MYSLPIGIGALLSSYITGRIIDRDFRVTKERLSKTHVVINQPQKGEEHHTDVSGASLFPIEHARLRSMHYCQCLDIFPCPTSLLLTIA